MARDAAGPARGPRGAGARRAAGRPDRHPAGLPAARPDLAGADDVTGPGLLSPDDMGLGKTITLIALHLYRQNEPGAAGPTLVVCPASLMGNWQREIERFA